MHLRSYRAITLSARPQVLLLGNRNIQKVIKNAPTISITYIEWVDYSLCNDLDSSLI